ncbi:hypothetical protein BO71DRAFT_100659 [Aspergillus ellipticus CBS 707.79]|uniref:Uncharacterized protein n=1 Tax=Aspergillus ellipticus CBS 707.79 TaxID=1448320 RepID=A0A319CWU8_9EURO|nr:hypothetical protein BO71DRAFT_100659 [Aspergillus ellipticus CBS 707.79]
MEFVTSNELSRVLVDFLDRFGYNDQAHLSSHDLQANYDFTLKFPPGAEETVRSLSEYVHCTFPFLPLEIRKAVAVYDSAFRCLPTMSPWRSMTVFMGYASAYRSGAKSSTQPGEVCLNSPPLSYAQTTRFRGAVEFIQATSVERTLFQGYPGSNYPELYPTRECPGTAAGGHLLSRAPVSVIRIGLP